MYENKLTYSLTVGLSISVCFGNLTLKMADILHYEMSYNLNIKIKGFHVHI
jgi:hypothetical protein